MTLLMESAARLYRADPEAMQALVNDLRNAAFPQPDQPEPFASAVGRIEGKIMAIDGAMADEKVRAERAVARVSESVAA